MRMKIHTFMTAIHSWTNFLLQRVRQHVRSQRKHLFTDSEESIYGCVHSLLSLGRRIVVIDIDAQGGNRLDHLYD